MLRETAPSDGMLFKVCCRRLRWELAQKRDKTTVIKLLHLYVRKFLSCCVRTLYYQAGFLGCGSCGKSSEEKPRLPGQARGAEDLVSKRFRGPSTRCRCSSGVISIRFCQPTEVFRNVRENGTLYCRKEWSRADDVLGKWQAKQAPASRLCPVLASSSVRFSTMGPSGLQTVWHAVRCVAA